MDRRERRKHDILKKIKIVDDDNHKIAKASQLVCGFIPYSDDYTIANCSVCNIPVVVADSSPKVETKICINCYLDREDDDNEELLLIH